MSRAVVEGLDRSEGDEVLGRDVKGYVTSTAARKDKTESQKMSPRPE